ncbi:MAG: hypothetical protein JNM52_07480 [Betaproteobacteria bacterium]|nr:hypothetical protein [Betaproteobacteria bacterium]
MKKTLNALLFSALASAAYAQPATPEAVPGVPPHTCVKPELLGSSRVTTDLQRKLFRNEFDKYKDCLQAYSAERQKIAEANVAAGNKAVAEFNDFVTALNKANDNGDNKSSTSSSNSSSEKKY